MLKKELATPTAEIESRIKTSAKLLRKKIGQLDEEINEVFKIEPNMPISAGHLHEVEQKVSALLIMNTLHQKNKIGKSEKCTSHSANIEVALQDFKRNISILALKKNLAASGIDIERL